MERSTSLKAISLVVIGILVLLEAGLLVSGSRILISEKLVSPGEHYTVEDWGDLGRAAQAQLACKFFTGRGTKTNVYWYSASNVMGRDSCPFVWRAEG